MSAALQAAAPRWGAVAREELRVAGLAIRTEMAVAAGGMGVVTLLSFAIDGHASWEYLGVALLMAVLGVFAPLGVWRGAEPARRAYFWSLPAQRGPHVLARVLGGWAWLMALAALFVFWVVLGNGLSGTETEVGFTVAQAEIRLDMPPEQRIVEMSLREHLWIWLVPFTAATVTYLLGTALALATDRPWRWVAGITLTTAFLVMLATEEQIGWLLAPLRAVLAGRFGLLTVLTGFPWRPWQGAGAWAATTLVWLLAALALVLAAAYRHRDA